MKSMILVLALVGSSAFASTYTGRLVIFCKAMPAGARTFSAASVEVSDNKIALKEFNSTTREFETQSIIPAADCVIGAESIVRPALGN